MGPFSDFRGFTAARLLIALRNSVAHGDDSLIAPWNRDDFLIGHQFTCVEKERGRESFRASLILLREDMRRIGCALADRHCAALNAAEGHDLREETRHIRETVA